MPDKLTNQERQLIDEAVAAGRVTVVPQGQSGVNLEAMSWMEQRDQHWRLANARLNRLNAAAGELAANRRVTGYRSPQSIEMDRKVAKLLVMGMTQRQIAAATGLTMSAVAQRIARMKRTQK